MGDERVGLGKAAFVEQPRKSFPSGQFAALVLGFDPGFTATELRRGPAGFKGVQLRGVSRLV